MRQISWLMLLATVFFAEGGAQWMQRADFGGIARNQAVGFSIGTKGYIGTGFDGSSRHTDFWEYDPSNNTWTQKANVGGFARNQAVGFSIDSKGYIGTGFDQNFLNRRDFWEYDPSNNTWTRKADFGGPARRSAVGLSIGTKGYIGTGFDGSSRLRDFWEYDPSNDTWTQKEDFGGLERSQAVGFSIGSNGFIGTGYTGSSSFKDFWRYSQLLNMWEQIDDFGGTARSSPVAFSISGKGYVGTGFDGSWLKDIWEWDGLTWNRVGDFGGNARTLAVGFSIGEKAFIGTGNDGNTYYKDFWQQPVERPTLQASNVSFTITGSASLGFQWTNGDGGRRLVLMKAGGAVDAVPADLATYTASTTFGSGTELGSGNYSVFSGTGNSVIVDGLALATTYHVAVFEFNGTPGFELYFTASPATGNQTTLIMENFDGPGGVGSKDGSSDLDLWLPADAGVMTIESSVNQWADQSGKGNDATQGTATNQPTLQPDVLNGKPVIRFDGSDYLQTASITSFDTDKFTWFLVVKSTNAQQVYLRNNYTSNATQWGSFTETDLFTSHARTSEGGFVAGQNTYNLSYNIISAAWNSGDSVIQHLNDSLGTIGTGANASPNGHRFMRIGANSPTTPDLFMNGDIAEAIVFSSQLNAAQRILIENYLGAKYRLPLETNVKYTGYDSIYTISVAGIGREPSGMHAEAHSDGLILRNINALSTNGEYFMAGHAMEANSTVTQDVGEGLAERWERVWYVTKSGSDGSGTLTIGFDYDKGLDGSPMLNPSEYRLIRRSGTTGDFSVVNTQAASIIGNIVTFDVSEMEVLDGYYTIGSLANDPQVVQNDGPGGVGRSDGLSRLELWLKSDAGVTTSGSSVTVWSDQSGSGNHATGPGSQPTLQSDVLNGKPVVRFERAGSQYLQTDSIASFNTDVFSWFMVLKSRGDVTQIYMRNNYNSNTNQWGSFIENGLFQSHARTSNATFVGSSNDYAADFHIISAAWNSGDSVIQHLNDSLGTIGTGANVSPSGHQFMRIGANSGNLSGFMDGDMAELIVFTADLMPVQRILIENYLSAKYAIPLTTNIKYSGHDPAYTISVAGIGREASGSHTEAHSDGLIIRNIDALTSDGEYIMAGYASTSNSVILADIVGGFSERWKRVWYVKKSNFDGSGNLILAFDYDQGGLSGLPVQDASQYHLLYKSATTGQFSVATTTGVTVAGNQVAFEISEAGLSDGYYTIGSAHSISLFDGPGGVGSKDGTSSLDVWLKADSGVTTSGSSVTAWSDQSGSGNDATGPGSQPTLQSDVLNGKPVVRFDRAGSQYLQTDSIASFNTDVFSWFMVLKSRGDVTQIYMRNNYSSNTNQWGSFIQNGLFQSHARTSLAAFVGSANDYAADFHIISAAWNSGDSVMQHLDGTAGTDSTGANASPSGHRFMRIGANSGDLSGFMDGDMAELIVFTADLMPVQRILIENYLSAKYAIPLTTNIKYSGHDPAYTISVAGIGREASGSHTEAHSDGLILRDVDALSLDGEYIMTAHADAVNSLVTEDVPSGVAERWKRVWYLKKSNTDNSGSLLMIFDYNKGGLPGSPALDDSDYRLLFRDTTSGEFSIVPLSGFAVSGSQVAFDIDESDLSGGYYTIGSTSNDPLPVQISAFTATASRLNTELKWRTESEVENYGFEVERRAVSRKYGVGSRENEGTNKRQDESPPKADQPLAETNQRQDESTNHGHHSPWTTVGFVQGSGTSPLPKEYSFVDRQLDPGRYAYRIKQIDHSGAFVYTDAVELEVGLAPLEFNLAQNYPNPFNPTTTIEFTLPQDGRVVLKVYDLQGQEVATLVDEERKAGIYQQVVFDASRLATGFYVARLQAGGKQLVKKMMLVK